MLRNEPQSLVLCLSSSGPPTGTNERTPLRLSSALLKLPPRLLWRKTNIQASALACSTGSFSWCSLATAIEVDIHASRSLPKMSSQEATSLLTFATLALSTAVNCFHHSTTLEMFSIRFEYRVSLRAVFCSRKALVNR